LAEMFGYNNNNFLPWEHGDYKSTFTPLHQDSRHA